MAEASFSRAPAAAAIQARLFGPFRIEAAEAARAPGRKSRALLAYLILTAPEPVSRERLAGLLWGDRQEEQARGSLRFALHELRGLANDEAPLLTASRAEVRLEPGRVETDLDRLRGLADGSDAAALAALLGEQPGDLLSDLGDIDPGFDDWLTGERVRRQEERRAIAVAVARRALAQGRVEPARAVADRLLAAEPSDEAATRLAMEARAQLGDRDGVRRVHARYVDATRRELDAAPSAELDALRAELTSAPPGRSGPAPAPASQGAGPQLNATPGRRALILGGVAAAVAALAGGGVLWNRLAARRAAPSPRSALLLQEAMVALRQDTRDGQKQAVGLLRRAVAEQPGFADGWGGLALAYAFQAHWRARDEAADLRARARAAADRALALAPRNAFAEAARAIAQPTRGDWRRTELALRRALGEHPDHLELSFVLAQLLTQVGRQGEAAGLFEKVRRGGAPSPGIYFREMMALWSANRPEETDRLIEEANQLFPGQFAVWFGRLYILMFSGRLAEAAAMLEDAPARPSGVPVEDFEAVRMVLRALQTRAKADVDRAVAAHLERAHRGAGYAENAIQFAAVLGRLDDAFAVAEAHYFNRGFIVPDVRFGQVQAVYTPLEERQTNLLFWPSTAALRADRRFQPLVAELGLARYWREAGVRPDYLRNA